MFGLDDIPRSVSRRTAAENLVLALLSIPLVYWLFSDGLLRIIGLPILIALLLAVGLGLRLLLAPKLLMEISCEGLYIARTHLAWPTITMVSTTRNPAGRYLIVAIDAATSVRSRYQVSERLSSVKLPELISIIQSYYPVPIISD